jgi:hypothetical protein
MQLLNITLVSGGAGAGKTTWIRQQVEAVAGSVFYLNLGLPEISVDRTYLAAEVPKLLPLSMSQLTNLLEDPAAQGAVYIELGFQIDLGSLVLPERMANCHRVAVLPPDISDDRWQDWADLVVMGGETKITLSSPHFWRSTLTGEVLDSSSLDVFWYELISGAYGTIQRAKAIFDVTDGRSLYRDFVAGRSDIGYLELNLPRWLDGRPKRFSGIEIVGEGLDEEAIAQTITSSCLSDRAIDYYQQQVKESLAIGVS